MSNTKVTNPVPNNPSTRIITLLESNDVSNLNQAGKWSNMLNENTIIEEGDQIVVRQAYVDTTTTGGNLISVQPDEAEITIQHGMYVTDSGDGSLENVAYSSPVGSANGQQAQNHTTYSDISTNHPNGKNYILQNQSPGNDAVRIFYNAGASGIGTNYNPGTVSFSMDMIPSTVVGDKFEYTIDTSDAAYAPALAPFFSPPNSTTSPILLSANLKGLRTRLIHKTEPKIELVFKIYGNGFAPPGTIDEEKDHIATLEQLFSGEKSPSGAPIPIGWQTTPNPNLTPGLVAVENQWVFRTALQNPPPTTPATAYQYWTNTSPSGGKTHRVLRRLDAFRMIVDSYRDQKKGAKAPYQTQFSYKTQLGATETKTINYTGWGPANKNVFGDTISYQGLFAQNEVYGPDYDLADLTTAKGRRSVGFSGTGKFTGAQQVFWIEFKQLQDRVTKDNIVLEPFTFDLVEGISAFSYVPDGTKKTRGEFVAGYALGIYNPFKLSSPGSVVKLSAGQMSHSPLPVPPPGGALLIPRIFTSKFTIPPIPYTYEALAQTLTDKFNEINTTVTGLSNDPFPADGSAALPLNPRGFSNSRFLTSTYELGMQVKLDAESGLNLPAFPSDVRWAIGDAQHQPVWVSEDGTEGIQYNVNILEGAKNARWCGAEAVSFIYDESSDAFQVAQSHSNIYSRVDGGVIARQFRTKLEDPATGTLVTTDKAGGIFFTSMEPKSLFFDKMKFKQHDILVEQFTNNPSVVNLKTNGGNFTDSAQNNLLENALTHTCNLRPSFNITGNFLGLTTYIDKRIAPNPQSDPAFFGGEYGLIDSKYTLDIAISAPITIRGGEVAEAEQIDPYFAIEINGLVNQDIVGAKVKNNLIQSIVGKYFSDGSFTSGGVDDSFRYTHIGQPMMLKSLSVRILDSAGEEVVGLGPNSAIILEIDKG